MEKVNALVVLAAVLVRLLKLMHEQYYSAFGFRLAVWSDGGGGGGLRQSRRRKFIISHQHNASNAHHFPL